MRGTRYYEIAENIAFRRCSALSSDCLNFMAARRRIVAGPAARSSPPPGPLPYRNPCRLFTRNKRSCKATWTTMKQHCRIHIPRPSVKVVHCLALLVPPTAPRPAPASPLTRPVARRLDLSWLSSAVRTICSRSCCAKVFFRLAMKYK